ncbi:MAG: hypothetical protein H7Y20_15250 [Bryobacteraceae bacterium]|nr:hypothetical protein [Bryobacteraceae bacterium]
MPNLYSLLEQTMLGKASPNPRWRFAWSPMPVVEAMPRPDAREEAVYENNPIWRFDSPIFAGAGVKVTNLSCKTRTMNHMKMPVLDLIEWGPVEIRRTQYTESISLPLTDQFLICSRYVKEGSIKGSGAGFWQLPANVDQSFEMVFGYEIPVSGFTSQPAPLSSDDISSDQLMPEALAALFHTDPGSEEFATLRTPPLRVVVVVSLVCCKERYDFVPGNVLGAGRVYPLLMIIANSALDHAVGAVKVARPPRAAHTEMWGETMTSTSSAAFFTDRNQTGFPGLPHWDNIFDYYWIRPPAGKYTMVTPSDQGRERIIRDGVTVHDRSSVLGREETSDRDVRKLPGQGEFDNVHMAPGMVASQEVLEANEDLKGLDNVTMAPFCMHDCFHMHWRWSVGFDDTYNKGWSGQTPYAVAGAPLVPGNQGVTLELLNSVTVRYTATAENPFPGQWQVIMHHGGAYAISINAKATAARQAVLSLAATQKVYIELGGKNPWTTFYWWLRYGRSWRSKQFERLRWTPKQFAALREVAAGGASVK